MVNKTCVKCGSILVTTEYKCNKRVWSDVIEWLEYTCIECHYMWKGPTLDNEEKS